MPSNAYHKILAVGCSHGNYANQAALDAVVKFRQEFKPHYCIHLGDFVDTAAFRTGAGGTADESEPITPDIQAGLEFLERLQPTHIRCGNHEDRLWRLRENPNAIISYAADEVIKKIEYKVRQLKAKFFPYLGVWDAFDPRSILRIGDYLWLHGVFYGESGNRDHAERFGNCVHAHDHRPSLAKGRRSDNATAYSVGTLSDIPAMAYAKTRAGTLAWAHGMVWGYVSTGKNPRCQLNLHQWERGETQWMLPR